MEQNELPSLGQFADSQISGTPPAAGTDPFSAAMSSALQSSVKQNYTPPSQTLFQRYTNAQSPGTQYWDANDVDKYIQQEDFTGAGFSPNDSYNYQRKIDQETWGSALSKGFDSAGYRFGNTFTDWWKDYGRMADALFSADWSKMRPDESTMIDQYYQDQIDMNKNFVFVSKEDEEAIFSKKMASDMIANSGFALGTFSALGLELAADAAITYLSGGLGVGSFAATLGRLGIKGAAKKVAKEAVEETAEQMATKGFSMSNAFTDILKGATEANQTADAIRASAKITKEMEAAGDLAAASRGFSSRMADAMGETFTIWSGNVNNMWKSKGIGELAGNVLKGTPLLGTGIRYGEKIAAGVQAGRNAFELTGMTLQGVRRLAQEMNMSATEASFEAVSTYGDSLDKMVQQYKAEHNGQAPSAAEFANMQKLAGEAAGGNYNTNLAILMVTNKLQFGNLFNRFTPANKFMRDALEESAEKMLTVEARDIVTGKLRTEVYKKGFFGAYGAVGEVVKDFGKREAAYQFGKAFVKDFARFEVTEGIQENLQEASASAWRDYYVARAKGVESSLVDAFGEGFADQFSKQGLKTFLMGALTGSVIRIPTALATKGLDAMNDAAVNSTYKNNPAENPIANAKKQFEEDFNTLKSMYSQMSKGQFEQKLYNFVNQMEASQEMAAAAAQGKRYEFENGKDNALLSAVLAAQRTNSIKAFQQAVRNSGMEMTAEEFEKAYGIKLSETKYATPEEFSNKIADDIGRYAKMIDGIKRKVGVLSDPMRFESGTSGQYMAAMQRKAEEEAIHTLALNMIKADMTIDRAQKLAQEMRSTPGLAGSADYAVRVMTDSDVLVAEIGNIMSEIKLMEDQIRAEGLTPDMKADLVKQMESKKKRRDYLERWMRYWVAEKQADGTTRMQFRGQEKGKAKDQHASGDGTTVESVEYDMKDPQVFEAFKEVMKLMNQEAGLNAEMSETVAQETFDKLVDYIQLDADSKAFLNSVDVLFNRNRFGNLLRNMTDGQFKYMLINYVDNILELVKAHAGNLIIRVGEDNEGTQASIIIEMAQFIMSHEAFKNLETLALDPNIGVKSQEYARKQEMALAEAIAKKMTEYYDQYLNKQNYGDISDDDYLTFKQTGELPWINLVGIARKIYEELQTLSEEDQAKATTFKTLSERETEVYTKYKKLVDPVVQEYMEAGAPKKAEAATEEKSTTTATPRAAKNADDDEEEDDEEVDDAEEIINANSNTDTLDGGRYKMVEDPALKWFGILDTETGDYWYDPETGMALWAEDKAEAEAKVAELNGGTPPASGGAASTASVPLMITKDMRQQLYDLGYSRSDVDAMKPEEANDILKNSTVKPQPAGATTNTAGAGMSSSDPKPAEEEEDDDDAEGGRSIDEIMKRMGGKPAEEETEEEPFEVEDTDEGFNVVDTNGDAVNGDPIATEEEATELKDSLVNTRSDIEVARDFLGVDSSAGQDAEFVRRGRLSMEKANAKHGTTHKNLQDYAATSRGRSALRTVATNVRKIQATDAPGEKPIVVSSEKTEVVDQFNTPSTGTATVLTLESLKQLDSKVQEFKAKVSEGAPEISKFVEEDTSTKISAPGVTMQELVDILNDIHACS